MPRVEVADLRQEWIQGKPTIFSRVLEDSIRERLSRGQQVMLLQNRRAYSTFLLCRECGFVMRCPNCAVSLKFHSADKRVSCHHCDFTKPGAFGVSELQRKEAQGLWNRHRAGGRRDEEPFSKRPSP